MCVHFVLIQQLFEPDSQLLDSTDDDAGIEDRDYGGLFAGYGGIGLTSYLQLACGAITEVLQFGVHVEI